ncbi:unnamed protein product [Nippostrongylus brasiliensis]|uniref:Acyl_transf_3 domain-containing protein n=1 Tax=Nippostrongylus brasiliensis TaxID=27835 RepID=A0A0N4XZ37_NIPBR|nr:unnamed protein product [Nippostrongylus brasiliensis]
MNEKRLDIQGIRGVAIILVLLCHFFPNQFLIGYIGVDIFFVLSGFLIALLLHRTSTIGFATIVDFYYRRIKRIIPLYFLAISVTVAAMHIFLPTYYRVVNADYAKAAFFLEEQSEEENEQEENIKLDESNDFLLSSESTEKSEISRRNLSPMLILTLIGPLVIPYIERPYMSWERPRIYILLATTCLCTAVLVYIPPSSPYPFPNAEFNYTAVNVSDASWNHICEVLSKTDDALCKTRVNYIEIVEELKPNLVFILDRKVVTKEVNDTKVLDNDYVFMQHLYNLASIEHVADKSWLILNDDKPARMRHKELRKRCKKCELIDYLPALVDNDGVYRGYDPDTNLMYVDEVNHLNIFAKQRLQPLFDSLAERVEADLISIGLKA